MSSFPNKVESELALMEETIGTMIKLNVLDYFIWTSQIKDILSCQNLYDPISGDRGKEDKKDKEQ